MKRFSFIFALLLAAAAAFAGNVPQFVDLGFSEDGLRYAFAQYGTTDVDMQAFAEIYIINVKDNDYVQNGVFKTEPSKETRGIAPKTLYMDLLNKNYAFLSANGINVSKPSTKPLYRLAPSAEKTEIIEFRDFENTKRPEKISYCVKLNEKVDGYGGDAVSSYSLDIEQRNSEDVVISRASIGNTRLKRTGVTSYKIYRVVSNPPEGGSIACIVEQIVTDKNGSSIRFQADTIRIGDF